MGNFALCTMITIDNVEMKWWYCTSCELKKGQRKMVYWVDVRTIETHLKSKPHGDSLTGDLRATNDERIRVQREREMEQQTQINNFAISNDNRNRAVIQQSESVHNAPTTEDPQVFQFDAQNEWHRNVMCALDHMNLKLNLSMNQMAVLNYFHTIHDEVCSMSSLSQMEKAIKREHKHGAMIPPRYHVQSSIMEAISVLAEAQREIDREMINGNRRFSICEDGNKLHGMAGRGYMVKVLYEYSLKEIFLSLKDPTKPPDSEYKELETIDSGADTFNAMKVVVESDLNRSSTDVVSIATDWSGCNGGKTNGASARVCAF